MNDLFALLLIGAVVFFMFRKGGMGCCGGHGGHDSSDSRNGHTDHSASQQEQSQTIDLNEADYTVLPSDTKEKQT
jgi:hypothetical protein